MNDIEYRRFLKETLDLSVLEKRISKLEKEISNYIDTWVTEETEDSDLLNIASMYSKLYDLQEEKKQLLTKVAISYKYIK